MARLVLLASSPDDDKICGALVSVESLLVLVDKIIRLVAVLGYSGMASTLVVMVLLHHYRTYAGMPRSFLPRRESRNQRSFDASILFCNQKDSNLFASVFMLV